MAELTAEYVAAGLWPAKPWLGWTRLAIGLAQGLIGYAIYENWEGMAPAAAGALGLATIVVPVVALGGLGAMRGRTVILWLLALAAVCAGIGAYDAVLGRFEPDLLLSPPTVLLTGFAAFLAHHLILGADQSGRWIAPYDRYFDETSKNGVRMALSGAFVGALWLTLVLAAALFSLIKIDAIEDLITKRWFAFPATTLFFAIGVQMTDVGAGLVRGARTLALSLLSWLLPLMALIAAAFLGALPFTGLQPLWDTGSATPILLGAAAALIILINAAYQEGEKDRAAPVVLKWAAKVAAVLIAPMVGIAAYGLALRISQYGLTPDRVFGAAAIAVGACYAAGALWAALGKGPWLKRLEPTNVITVCVAVAVILLIQSPVLDPTRMSVASQLHRLELGRVAADAFDYRFLKFEAGTIGRNALETLAKGGFGKEPAKIAEKASYALMSRDRNALAGEPVRPLNADAFDIMGQAPLPAGFVGQVWSATLRPDDGCARDKCPALVADLTGDSREEVVVFKDADAPSVYGQAGSDATWRLVGFLLGSTCGDVLQANKDGKLRLSPRLPGMDVEVNGSRMAFQRSGGCDAGFP